MAKTPAPEPAAPFEQRLEELEALVRRLESPEVPLETAMALFEQGMKLSEECRTRLADAEAKVEILLGKGQSAVPAPFEPEDE
jgi:exodeoxyribonuclease VII small subunit